MRVTLHPDSKITLALIPETSMNKGIEAIYEGMRVKTLSTFSWKKYYLYPDVLGCRIKFRSFAA